MNLSPEKLDELYALAKEAAPGPWMLQNSCSWRRIGTDPGTCGDVLCPVVRRDGQPDIEAPMGTLEYIAAASPDVVTGLIDQVRSYPAGWRQDSSLETWFPFTAEQLKAHETELASRKRMLDMVINSVAGALERAGVTEVDDPGEAIDVLVADKDAEITRLRTVLEDLIRDHHSPLDAATTNYFWNQARAALNKE